MDHLCPQHLHPRQQVVAGRRASEITGRVEVPDDAIIDIRRTAHRHRVLRMVGVPFLKFGIRDDVLAAKGAVRHAVQGADQHGLVWVAVLVEAVFFGFSVHARLANAVLFERVHDIFGGGFRERRHHDTSVAVLVDDVFDMLT